MFIARARLLLTALWSGSLWTVGYLIAPTLFVSFDQALAGAIAASLFRAEAWLSVVCGILLLAMQLLHDRRIGSKGMWLIVAMLACTVIGYFCLHPFMAALREASGSAGDMTPDAKLQFGILHGISSGIYLIESLLGAALMLSTVSMRKT